MSRPSPPVRTDRRLPLPLIDSPSFVLMQAGRLAMEWTTEALEPFELSIAEYATLAIVRRLGPMGQAALAERLGISEVAMSGVASSLEDSGLATRMLHYFDGRRRLLCITASGSELVAAAADELASAESPIPQSAVEALAELAPEDVGPIIERIRQLGWG